MNCTKTDIEMGAVQSLNVAERAGETVGDKAAADGITMGEVYDAFDEFLEANCVRGSDKHVHIQELESAYAFFLTAKGGWSHRRTMYLAHEFVLAMSIERGFQASPGYANESTKLDTRRIVGVSVVRFQK